MRLARHPLTLPLVCWLTLTLAGGLVLVRFDIAERRSRFQAEARTVHRLLSQQAAQHEAVLGSLVVLDSGESDLQRAVGGGHGEALQRLPALFPQLLAVQRRSDAADWMPHWPGHAPTAASPTLASDLAAAEARSRAQPSARRAAVMTAFDPDEARYALVLAGRPASYALWIDLRQMTTRGNWPALAAASGRIEPGQVAVDIRLAAEGGSVTLREGRGGTPVPFGLTDGFRFDEAIDSPAQPFRLSLQRATGPADWPWPQLALWALAMGLLVAAVQTVRQARAARHRASEMARLRQMTQLNSLGELAAGIAHELNQPLAAVLSSSQAARRLRDEHSPAHPAVSLAAAQARRAADVLARLRRLIEPVREDRPRVAVDVLQTARQLLELLAPELRRERIDAQVSGTTAWVRADPVALEQVLYNLVRNAMQALVPDGAAEPAAAPARPSTSRRITIRCAPIGSDRIRRDPSGPELPGAAAPVRISVRDNGPGIAAAALPRLFEPFFTTRERGLGLGLALCDTLARAQDGRLEAIGHADGAEFVLTLPGAADDVVRPTGDLP